MRVDCVICYWSISPILSFRVKEFYPRLDSFWFSPNELNYVKRIPILVNYRQQVMNPQFCHSFGIGIHMLDTRLLVEAQLLFHRCTIALSCSSSRTCYCLGVPRLSIWLSSPSSSGVPWIWSGMELDPLQGTSLTKATRAARQWSGKRILSLHKDKEALMRSSLSFFHSC